MNLIKSISAIASASVISQIIGAFSIWLLSHQYNMSVVGEYAQIYSIILIGAQFCTYGTQLLIPKQTDKLLSGNVIYCTLQSIIISVLYALIITLFFEKSVVLIFSLTLGQAFVLISENLLLRDEKIKLLTYQRLSISLLVMLSIVVSTTASQFYVVWAICLNLVIAGWGYYSIKNIIFQREIFSLSNNICFFKDNREYISRIGSAETLAMVNLNLPVILIGFWFSPVVAGYFAVVTRFCLAPITIVGNAVRNSIFSKWSINFRENVFNFDEFKKIRLLLFVLACISVAGVAIFYPLIMKIGFSAEWEGSVPTAYYMLPFLFPAMAICPLTVIELIYGSPRYFLQIQLEQLLVVFISFVILPCFYSNYAASVVIYSLLSFVRYSFIYIKVNKRARLLESEGLKHAN